LQYTVLSILVFQICYRYAISVFLLFIDHGNTEYENGKLIISFTNKESKVRIMMERKYYSFII
jgi:hypothetical protein